ncbi:unnamed protein product [Periconia digitata]|uniref:Uncharacterized protein n=1 Tax=Periconia digitata TaxID=1303443 RepID=A0A9W4U9W1_9PLEO|nr:unnamed protein product [Periconia digitata]
MGRCFAAGYRLETNLPALLPRWWLANCNPNPQHSRARSKENGYICGLVIVLPPTFLSHRSPCLAHPFDSVQRYGILRERMLTCGAAMIRGSRIPVFEA